jgi:hypothetical protein
VERKAHFEKENQIGRVKIVHFSGHFMHGPFCPGAKSNVKTKILE